MCTLRLPSRTRQVALLSWRPSSCTRPGPPACPLTQLKVCCHVPRLHFMLEKQSAQEHSDSLEKPFFSALMLHDFPDHGCCALGLVIGAEPHLMQCYLCCVVCAVAKFLQSVSQFWQCRMLTAGAITLFSGKPPNVTYPPGTSRLKSRTERACSCAVRPCASNYSLLPAV